MIEFYDGENLDFQGQKEYKKAIASAYGLDKKPDHEKLIWFKKNQNVLHLRQNNAKKPYEFQALIRGWKDHKQGLKVHTPIHLDATCSQSQIMAVLLKSKAIAETCNVVNTYEKDGTPVIADLYGLIADKMSDILSENQQQAI